MKAKTKRIEIGGGFHCVPYSKFFVPSEAFEALKGGDKARFFDLLPERQINRIQAHLCGLKGCVCGGRGWEWGEG